MPHGVGYTHTRVKLQGEGGSWGCLKAGFWGCDGRRGRHSRYLACTQVGYGHGSPRLCAVRRAARLEASRSDFALSRHASAPGGRRGRIGSRGGGRAIPWTGDRTTRPEGSLRDYHEATTANTRRHTHTKSVSKRKHAFEHAQKSMKSRPKIVACAMEHRWESPLSRSAHCPYCGWGRRSEQFEKLSQFPEFSATMCIIPEEAQNGCRINLP